MTILRINALVTLLSSVSHIGETMGTDAVFHRTKYVQPSGEVVEVPEISGNSIRGILRDAAALYLFDLLDLAAVPLSSFYTLFSGGSLNKVEKGASLDDIRALRAALPMLSLFGTAAGNQILRGRWDAGKLKPIARETLAFVPAQYARYGTESVYDLMQTESYTRRDDAKDDRYEHLFERGEALPDKPQQMRYEVETMAAGTRLAWYIVFNYATEMEMFALVSALHWWSRNPVLGGKSAVGHGLARVEFENGWRIDPNEGAELPDLSAYDGHLHSQAVTIREALHGL